MTHTCFLLLSLFALSSCLALSCILRLLNNDVIRLLSCRRLFCGVLGLSLACRTDTACLSSQANGHARELIPVHIAQSTVLSLKSF